MPSKFKVGDKVTIKAKQNKRTPQYVRDAVRLDRARTIVGIHYDKKTKHNRYYLGGNKKGSNISGHPFRAVELRGTTHQIGRPRKKRKYRSKVV